MEDQKLFENTQRIIWNMLGVDKEEITRGADLVNDLGTDSLDNVELIIAFEEAYDIEIADEDAEKVRTVQDIVDYLKRRGVTPLAKVPADRSPESGNGLPLNHPFHSCPLSTNPGVYTEELPQAAE